MKKVLSLFIIVAILSLCSCSSSIQSNINSVTNVDTLKGWSFQYNEGTNDYSVFFGLLTDSNRYTSADVDVDVRIVNDDGTVVYEETHYVSKNDFDYYSSMENGDQFLANLRIPASNIDEGSSSNGKVYLTVYKGDFLRFDEVNCLAMHCLPTKEVNLVAEVLPIELDVKGYDGSVESRIKIDDVSFVYDNDYSSNLEIIFSGSKLQGSLSSDYDIICYKIYDSEKFVVDSGDVFLSGLSEGDRFRDDSIVVYDVVPGENYTIKFSEFNW